MIRVASGQGFWGDQLDAPLQQIENGPIDYLMLDYLAEVTMSILQKQYARDPNAGYATDFVPLMREALPRLLERGIRVVANAGGVNPNGCADAVRRVAREIGIGSELRIGVVTGDDILSRLPELIERGVPLRHMDSGAPLSSVLAEVRSANVYLGAAPMVAALREGATIIVTGRVMDTALTCAPLIHEFDWSWTDYDRIAAGIVAGHVIECGAQASGGNLGLDWETVPDLANVGYPIIEAEPDGSFVVTKHPRTGGRVSVATVKEQLVYEIGDPTAYLSPDAIADFTALQLEEVGNDRVRVSGCSGRAPTDHFKVSISYAAGYRAIGSLVFAWPDAIRKAQAADRVLRERLDRLDLRFEEIHTEYVGWNATHGPLAGPPPDLPEVMVRWAVRSTDHAMVDRFTREIAPLVLSGPPTATGYGGGRPKVQEVIAYWPALIPKSEVLPHVRVSVTGA